MIDIGTPKTELDWLEALTAEFHSPAFLSMAAYPVQVDHEQVCRIMAYLGIYEPLVVHHQMFHPGRNGGEYIWDDFELEHSIGINPCIKNPLLAGACVWHELVHARQLERVPRNARVNQQVDWAEEIKTFPTDFGAAFREFFMSRWWEAEALAAMNGVYMINPCYV